MWQPEHDSLLKQPEGRRRPEQAAVPLLLPVVSAALIVADLALAPAAVAAVPILLIAASPPATAAAAALVAVQVPHFHIIANPRNASTGQAGRGCEQWPLLACKRGPPATAAAATAALLAAKAATTAATVVIVAALVAARRPAILAAAALLQHSATDLATVAMLQAQTINLKLKIVKNDPRSAVRLTAALSRAGKSAFLDT